MTTAMATGTTIPWTPHPTTPRSGATLTMMASWTIKTRIATGTGCRTTRTCGPTTRVNGATPTETAWGTQWIPTAMVTDITIPTTPSRMTPWSGTTRTWMGPETIRTPGSTSEASWSMPCQTSLSQ